MLFSLLQIAGSPVFAMWHDNHYYHGHILEKKGGKYTVAFDDGDIMECVETEMVLSESLVVGQEVLACREHWSESAVIQDMQHRGDEPSYYVEFSDGMKKR